MIFQGVGTTTYAIDFLLERLYADYGDLIDKKRRRDFLHRQISFGKRLTRLSGYLGLGICLTASLDAMKIM
jgi:hypothetical protein